MYIEKVLSQIQYRSPQRPERLQNQTEQWQNQKYVKVQTALQGTLIQVRQWQNQKEVKVLKRIRQFPPTVGSVFHARR
jgi:hypothetical protein